MKLAQPLNVCRNGKNYEYVLNLSQNHDQVKDTDDKKSLTKN